MLVQTIRGFAETVKHMEVKKCEYEQRNNGISQNSYLANFIHCSPTSKNLITKTEQLVQLTQ